MPGLDVTVDGILPPGCLVVTSCRIRRVLACGVDGRVVCGLHCDGRSE